MKRFATAIVLALCGPAASGGLTPGAAHLGFGSPDNAPQDAVREAIRTRLEATDGLSAAGEPLFATEWLRAFYEQRGYAPVWIAAGDPTAGAGRLVHEIARSGEEGLHPADYHLETIRGLVGDIAAETLTARSGPAADLELLLSDAFLLLGSHYLSGRVDPATVHPEWVAHRRSTDLTITLAAAVGSGDPAQALQALLPPQPGYARLREALAGYRTLRVWGGWPAIDEGPTLHPGDRGPRVAQLQARLLAVRDLAPGSDSTEVFGAATEAAVREAQRRFGLEPDGVVGAETLAALNRTVDDRILQLVLNMERWRWLPQDLGDPYILVNIADYELGLVEGGREVLSMRVAVGRPFRRTPVFSDRITHIVLSPYWHVPTNLAVQDKLPEIQRVGLDWFTRNHMKVLRGWGSEEREVDPATIDWRRLGADNFPYRLRQDPGPGNALGRVKFMFPNRFNVYLHDTPGREIFNRAERAFSSGCIRIQKPMELALRLVGDQGWTPERLQAAADAGVERTVNLTRPVPIHILYWTAWADPDGRINFRRDIYGRDTPLAAALAEAPPRPAR